ncbi:MAG: carboxypeptidase-like regulatory domain-containing protein [Leadbetterella sp.]|nr:carboxypeptidase-like regulatory domain-containing protein [Leadbetterella sp.]
MRLNLFLFFQFSFLLVQSQKKLSGIVTDSTNTPIENATIVIEDAANQVLSFGFTDAEGQFSLVFNSSAQLVKIKVSNMAFQPLERIIENKTQKLTFVLQIISNELEGLSVYIKSIQMRGDTIEFDAGRLKSKEDRVLADLLKRLPGVELESNGNIKYQGKPINKFYVEGKDLMEGSYGQIVSSLSVDEIAKIQVLERHQPIKLFRNKISNENAGINVVLYDKKVKTGRLEVQTGYRPILWNSNTSRIHFSDKNQSLQLLKANNTALDIISEQQSFSLQDRFENNLTETTTTPLISTSKTTYPNIDRVRFVNNRSIAGSTNFLKSFSNDRENKFNLSLYRNDENYNSKSIQSFGTVFSEIPTINKVIDNSEQGAQIKLKNTLIRNSDLVYSKNITFLRVNSGLDHASTLVNKSAVEEELSKPSIAFENNYKLIKNINDNNISFYSKIKYDAIKQVYQTRQDASQLITGYDFRAYQQGLQKNEFRLQNGATLLLNVFKWNFLTTFENELQMSSLQTRLSGGETSAKVILPSFGNLAKWKSSNTLIKPFWIRTGNKSEVNLELPIRWFWVQANNDSSSFVHFDINTILIEPRFSWIQKMNRGIINSVSVHYFNEFGNIDNLLNNPYFTNLGLNNQNSVIPRSQNLDINNFFEFKSIRLGLFFNHQIGFRKIGYNTIQERKVLSEGFINNTSISDKNVAQKAYYNSSISHYISRWKLKYGLSVFQSFESREIMLNSKSFNLYNQNSNLKLALSYNKYTWAKVDVESVFRQFSNNMDDLSKDANINVNYGIIVREKHYFTVKGNLRNVKFNQFIFRNKFLDAEYQYTFEKHLVDFNITVNNILNQKQMIETLLTEFGVLTNINNLRPRQFLVGVSYNLKR